jgi:S-adenosyl methyltransferase
VAEDAAAAGSPVPELDTSVSHSARIWNYWLGGTDNYAADRQAGDKVAEMLPIIVVQARADRAFLGRAVHYLAGAEGHRQFLDIGTGLPTADNTHEAAQRVAPMSTATCMIRRRSSPMRRGRSTWPSRLRWCSSASCTTCPTSMRRTPSSGGS